MVSEILLWKHWGQWSHCTELSLKWLNCVFLSKHSHTDTEPKMKSLLIRLRAVTSARNLRHRLAFILWPSGLLAGEHNPILPQHTPSFGLFLQRNANCWVHCQSNTTDLKRCINALKQPSTMSLLMGKQRQSKAKPFSRGRREQQEIERA